MAKKVYETNYLSKFLVIQPYTVRKYEKALEDGGKKKFGVSTAKDFVALVEKSSGWNLTPIHRVFVADQE